ncbi:MAG TPA: hypothetical protein VFQ25_00555 [Ktedonobacterales bacterium]|nr:hypothetical protein [Ktedonobacterales bacterium]
MRAANNMALYTGQRSPQQPQGPLERRSGLVGWWLNLTAPPRPTTPVSRDVSERLRKAELTSLSLLPILALLIALVSNSLVSLATAQAVGLMAIVLVITAALNRSGYVRIAAYLVPSILFLLLAFSLISAPGLRLIGLPIYDLFVLPIFLISLTGERSAPWYFAALAIIFIVADYLLQPHDPVRVTAALSFDEISYEQTIFGVWGMINRHVALCFFAAFFGWLGARSVDLAIARADRAEEIAHLESLVADQKRALDYGIEQLTQAFVRSANGDYNARVTIPQQNPLWGIGAQMNTFVQRLASANQASFELERARQEAYRLAVALDDWRAGRVPIWPAPSGTVVDPLIQRLTGARPQIGDGNRSFNPPGAGGMGGAGGFGDAGGSGGSGGSSPFGWG